MLVSREITTGGSTPTAGCGEPATWVGEAAGFIACTVITLVSTATITLPVSTSPDRRHRGVASSPSLGMPGTTGLDTARGNDDWFATGSASLNRGRARASRRAALRSRRAQARATR